MPIFLPTRYSVALSYTHTDILTKKSYHILPFPTTLVYTIQKNVIPKFYTSNESLDSDAVNPYLSFRELYNLALHYHNISSESHMVGLFYVD